MKKVKVKKKNWTSGIQLARLDFILLIFFTILAIRQHTFTQTRNFRTHAHTREQRTQQGTWSMAKGENCNALQICLKIDLFDKKGIVK